MWSFMGKKTFAPVCAQLRHVKRQLFFLFMCVRAFLCGYSHVHALALPCLLHLLYVSFLFVCVFSACVCLFLTSGRVGCPNPGADGLLMLNGNYLLAPSSCVCSSHDAPTITL